MTLYDADTAPDGSGYLVMEYVDGGTLADRIALGPLAPHHVASIAADLGDALHVVHAAGVIHRDIKPSNVLLRATDGRPFQATLADFGIAYLVDGARMTTPGMAVGTAAYFSPEQARGAQPSPESDIYALGLVLIEALTGRRAFPQTTPIEAAIARLHTPPEVPTAFGYGWRSLLTAMTATDPAVRPTAAQVAERARALRAGEAPAEATAAMPAAPATEAVPATPAGSPTPAPPTSAVHASDEAPTRVAPVPALRRRDRRARRPLRSRLVAAGVGAAVVGFGLWGGAAALTAGPEPVGARQLVSGQDADRTGSSGEQPAPADPQQGATIAEPAQGADSSGAADAQTAQNRPAPQDRTAQQGTGPGASAGRGDGAAERAAAGAENQGKGKGRSGDGKPDR